MKRRWPLILVLLCIPLVGFQASNLLQIGRPLQAFSTSSALYQNMTLTNEDVLGRILILPEKSFNEVEAAHMIQRLDQLPAELLQELVNQEVTIRLFNGALTDFTTTERLQGVRPRGYENSLLTWDDVPGMGGQKTVYAKIGASQKGNGHGSVNLELHELAHTIDKVVYKFARDDVHFIQAWKKEAPQLFPGQAYFSNYPEEYFAETFAYYYYTSLTKQELYEKAPETFVYFQELEERLRN
ncbi:anthrax toxin lethal factor-related metalloendopeptidase [Bacillus fonticola]|uniref:anthrax toxin lethal factor-related metalloendopeptidase n=1 Tax=Bacillus fonticola TaxID=2728853 RepID=UPI00147281F1|nr:toxin [Bacillus fonticola]